MSTVFIEGVLMRILVDADACPVKEIIVKTAKEHHISVEMFFDNAHQYEDGYSIVHILDKGRDSVDYALINATKKGDIVVTQDYGVASMALAKQAKPIHQNGLIFNEDNILGLLEKRAHHQKLRKHIRVKGPKKRTSKNDEDFLYALQKLINSN